MLNKTVCQECYSRNRSYWTEVSEIAWERGHVTCPAGSWRELLGHLVYINQPPPEWCKYSCEHLVSQT